ncbi:MAG: SDR family oxidoreductase [Brevibacterium sp.]
MRVNNQTAFVTGGNRGIGREFVRALLERGAAQVYAGVRDPRSVDEEMAHDPYIEIVPLDVTDSHQIASAAELASDTAILINNAGAVSFGSLLNDPVDDARRLFETNVFGPWEMTRAFAPALIAAHGAVVNVLSGISWFSPPQNGAYAATKSAAWSLTNGLRAELNDHEVDVQALHFGAVDTDFSAGYDGPKISANEVVTACLDGLESGQDEVLVDAGTHALKASLSGPPNGYLRQFQP